MHCLKTLKGIRILEGIVTVLHSVCVEITIEPRLAHNVEGYLEGPPVELLLLVSRTAAGVIVLCWWWCKQDCYC